MTREDVGRLAIAVVLGVIGAVAITKPELSPQEAILRWLIFALVTGVIVNTQEGKSGFYLLGASVLSSLSLVCTILWLGLLGEGVIPSVSAVKLDLINSPAFAATVLSGLWFVSSLAVFVCAFSRPITLGLIHDVIAIELDKAKKIESLLRVLVSAVGTLMLLIFSII
jgi:hypothetical protein